MIFLDSLSQNETKNIRKEKKILLFDRLNVPLDFIKLKKEKQPNCNLRKFLKNIIVNPKLECNYPIHFFQDRNFSIRP